MANKTVFEFAQELKVAAKTLLTQLKAAGVSKNSESDELSEGDKTKLLESLRLERASEGDGTAPKHPRRITVTRKEKSVIRKADATGRTRTVQVEVRRRRVFVKNPAIEAAQKAEVQKALAERIAAEKAKEAQEAAERARVAQEAAAKAEAEKARQAAEEAAAQAAAEQAAKEEERRKAEAEAEAEVKAKQVADNERAQKEQKQAARARRQAEERARLERDAAAIRASRAMQAKAAAARAAA